MLKSVRLASVLLISLFVGCRDGIGPTSLGINRLRWESQNLHNYQYTARRGCFCPESGQEVLVTVVSDAVVSVTLVATGAEVSTEGWHTVPQLFDLVEGAVDEVYESVSVEFDPDLATNAIDHVRDYRPSIAGSQSKRGISFPSASSRIEFRRYSSRLTLLRVSRSPSSARHLSIRA